MEKWKPIKIVKGDKYYDFTGKYEVSSKGKVRSVDRLVNDRWGNKRLLTGKEMKVFNDKDGYCLVHLFDEGVGSMFKVHRLVAEAFIENPDDLPLINHKDEDKTNNNVENLEWCDYYYNAVYGDGIAKRIESYKRSWTPERMQKMLESRTANGSFSAPIEVEQIDPITKKVVGEYKSISEAGRLFGRHVWQAVQGKRKTCGGYIWRIKNK